MFQIHPSNPALLATISVVPVLLYWYYSKSGSKKPRLHCVKSAFTDYVAKRCLQLDRPFEPTSWACNRHLQTLVGSLQPRAVVQWSREYVDLPDGGCCALDWGQLPANDANPASTDGECTENMPVFIALPGLTGDAQSMSHLCKRALSRGYRPVVFNKRGHGGSKLTTPKLQSFGDPEDFRVVVKHVQSKYPHCTLTALGSSAGSGLLASYLGEYGTDCILSFAVFVSPGYDAEFMFNNCIEHPYDFLLMSMLKKLLNNNREMLAQAVDMDRVMGATSLISLEEELYCTLYGYSSMDEYWQNNNPVRKITNIHIPILTLSSLDDPVCSESCIDYSLFEQTSAESILVTTHHGGHCGFFEGWNLEHWADKLALDYLDACLEYSTDPGEH